MSDAAGPVRLSFDGATLVVEGLDGLAPPTALTSRMQWDARRGVHRALAYLYRPLVEWLHRAGIEYDDGARAYGSLELTHRARFELWRHQREAVEAWTRAGRRGVVVLPTGAGKTAVAEWAIAATRRSTLVVVPTLELMGQWYDRLATAFGIEPGLLGGGNYRIDDITVATYDSAYIHVERFGNRFGLVVFDEVHHLPGPSLSQAAEGCIAPFRLGLTATPERDDGAHVRLDDLVGPIVYRASVTALRGAVLADYDVVTVTVDFDADEREAYQAARRTWQGFLAEEGIVVRSPEGWRRFLVAAARSKRGRLAYAAWRKQKALAMAPRAKFDALEEILTRHWGERALVFTHDNATAFAIARRFLVPVITHRTQPVERRAVLEAFREGRLKTVVTSRVLNEGVDVPAASVGVVVSGTGSVREHVQRLGRILRRAEGKRAVLYELVTASSSEVGASRRRRAHDAYR